MSPSATPSVAVVGAGVSGLAAAGALRDAGRRVVVFDKARGVGGRCSTRRSERGGFDHGAQYFTARTPELRARVEAWMERGHVAPWAGRLVHLDELGRRRPAEPDERFVGRPGMSAVAHALAEGLDVRTDVRVGPLEAWPEPDEPWVLHDLAGAPLGAFDELVLTPPPAQAADLLRPCGEPTGELVRVLEQVPLEPCLALMVAFERPLTVPFDGAFLEGEPLAWAARDSAKPDRAEGERWVLHTTAEYAGRVFDRPDGDLVPGLLMEFSAAIDRDLPDARHAALHRWRYARPTAPRGGGVLYHRERRLALAGDWCLGARLEDAFTSGLRAAEHLRTRGEAGGG